MSKREEECVYVCVYIWEVYMSGFSAHVHALWLCVH